MASTIRAACVMGWPVKHSRSPMIHGYWLKQHGIDGDYRREEVSPEDFPAFLTHLAKNGYVGGNVTIPHKDVALKLSRAGRAGARGRRRQHGLARQRHAALNQYRRRGIHRQPRRDGAGLGQGPRKGGPAGRRRRGARGLLRFCSSARSSASTSSIARWRGRKSFASVFGPSIIPTSWQDLPKALEGAGLIANATSLGMKGNPELEIDLSPMRKDAVVGDVVYVPLTTGLLKNAARAACAPRTASACCCIRPAAASNCGSACVRRSPRSCALWWKKPC